MDMRLFEYTAEIYRKGSFTKAADSLHIAQPSHRPASRSKNWRASSVFLCFIEKGEPCHPLRKE